MSICFDGGYPEHLARCASLMESRGWRASFFPAPARLFDDPAAWRSLPERGHEIGNHSLFGIADHGSLLNWTLEMVQTDIQMTQDLLDEIFGTSAESFALPGWSTACMDGDYLPFVQEQFRYVRSDERGINRAGEIDAKHLKSMPLHPLLIKEVRALLSNAEPGDWLILRVGELDRRLAGIGDDLVALLEEIKASTALVGPIRELGESHVIR
ncbi:MAG: polysaccharide deacetylase family protein [Armatimonadetes bacterium]|nr:polysaccharide deacetylase family protein [Armatimonadota bacterium]